MIKNIIFIMFLAYTYSADAEYVYYWTERTGQIKTGTTLPDSACNIIIVEKELLELPLKEKGRTRYYAHFGDRCGAQIDNRILQLRKIISSDERLGSYMQNISDYTLNMSNFIAEVDAVKLSLISTANSLGKSKNLCSSNYVETLLANNEYYQTLNEFIASYSHNARKLKFFSIDGHCQKASKETLEKSGVQKGLLELESYFLGVDNVNYSID